MPSAELQRLVKIGQLKVEAPGEGEVLGLVRSGEARLVDAQNADLALESRFDLAYNAAHALALAPAFAGSAIGRQIGISCSRPSRIPWASPPRRGECSPRDMRFGIDQSTKAGPTSMSAS